MLASASTKACGECGKAKGMLKKCAGCNGAYFCNEECQRASWAQHKPVCLVIKAIPEHVKAVKDIIANAGTDEEKALELTFRRFQKTIEKGVFRHDLPTSSLYSMDDDKYLFGSCTWLRKVSRGNLRDSGHQMKLRTANVLSICSSAFNLVLRSPAMMPHLQNVSRVSSTYGTTGGICVQG